MMICNKKKKDSRHPTSVSYYKEIIDGRKQNIFFHDKVYVIYPSGREIPECAFNVEHLKLICDHFCVAIFVKG